MSATLDLVLHGAAVPTWLLDRLLTLTKANAVHALPPQAIRLTNAQRHPDIAYLCAAEKLDFAYIETGKRLTNFALLAMDMDSTLITIECIDELADFAGQKPAVARITEAAMRGEMDYTESLRQRVSLLAGLSESALAKVYEERLRLSQGAEILLRAAKAAGLKTMLVSGGFTYFTHRLQTQLGLDYAVSNELEIKHGQLTGRILGDIVDAQGKAQHVARVRGELGLNKSQVITMGDGANDLLMMAESSLSVAYHAKPVAQAEASVAINFAGLDGLLAILAC